MNTGGQDIAGDSIKRPMDQRMTWVATSVVPVSADAVQKQRECAWVPKDETSTRIAFRQLKLRPQGEKIIFPSANRLGTSGMQIKRLGRGEP